MENMKIREEAAVRGIRLWQVAERLGISDGNLSRLLRRELPPEKQREILGIIESLEGTRR